MSKLELISNVVQIEEKKVIVNATITTLRQANKCKFYYTQTPVLLQGYSQQINKIEYFSLL